MRLMVGSQVLQNNSSLKTMNLKTILTSICGVLIALSVSAQANENQNNQQSQQNQQILQIIEQAQKMSSSAQTQQHLLRVLQQLQGGLLVNSDGLQSDLKKPVVKFNRNGKFKVVQFTDIHYCGDEVSQASIRLMREVLDAERPDFVIFTGDIVVAGDEAKLWDEVTSVVARKNIPYAITLGNHDSERLFTREQTYSKIATLPYCVNPFYNRVETDREGDFVVPVMSKDQQSQSLSLYIFDSNEYNSDKSYAGIQKDQVSWYEKMSRKSREQNDGKVLPALAFFHVPLHEFEVSRVNNIHGLHLEKECPGRDNSGLFDAFVAGGDVKGVFVGHDHVNDYITYNKGIALGYGRFSGTSTYQDLLRGARVFEFTDGVDGFDTWVRIEGGTVKRKVNIPTGLKH